MVVVVDDKTRTQVRSRLQELQARSEVEQKIQGGSIISDADREAFPDLAQQQDDINEIKGRIKPREPFVVPDLPESFIPDHTGIITEDVMNDPDPFGTNAMGFEPIFDTDELKRAFWFSQQFGFPLETTMPLTDPLVEKYGDPVKMPDNQRGFLANIKESAIRGHETVASDVAIYNSVWLGQGDSRATLDARRKLNEEIALDPIEGSLIAEIVYGGANVATGWLTSSVESLPEMAAGGLVGTAAGAVVGAPAFGVGALPGAVIGGRIGLKAGYVAGTVDFWYRQGAGAMYAEMTDEGTDPEVAQWAASIAAVPYAAIELSQISRLTPGLRRTAQQGVKKGVMKVIREAIKQYGKTWSAEVFEEVQQKIVTETAGEMAGAIDAVRKLLDTDAPVEVQEERRRLAEEAIEETAALFDPTAMSPEDKARRDEALQGYKESVLDSVETLTVEAIEAAKSLALLPVGNVAVDITTGTREVLDAKKRADVNAKLDADKTAAFTASEKTDISDAAKATIEIIEDKGPLAPAESQKLDFLKANQNNPNNLILGFGMEHEPTTSLELTGDVLEDTVSGKLESLVAEFVNVEPDPDGTRRLVFQTAADAQSAAQSLGDRMDQQGEDISMHINGNILDITVSPEQEAELTGEPVTPPTEALAVAPVAEPVTEAAKAVPEAEAIQPPVEVPEAELLEQAREIPEAPEAVEQVEVPETGEIIEPSEKEPFEMTRAEFQEAAPVADKPNDVFFVKIGNKDVEVIQNPTSSDRRQLSREVRDEFPDLQRDEPTTRSTRDIAGNEFIWKAGDAIHVTIEPLITERIGESVGQNLERPTHQRVVFDAVKAGESVPLNVLQEFEGQEFADEAIAELQREEIPTGKRIITQEAFDAALKRFTDQSKVTTGIDPQQLKDAVIIGAFHFESGIRRFGAWSKRMIADLGESIQPHLREVWTDMRAAIKEGESLRRQVRGEKKAAAVGFKAGERASREKAKVAVQKLKQAQRITEARKQEAAELVKAFAPKEQRADFLKRVAAVKTPKNLEKIIEAIEKGITRAEKRESIGRLNKAVKAIKPKKMLPEFRDQAQSLVDSLQAGKLRPESVVRNDDLKDMAQQVLDQTPEGVDSAASFAAERILAELRSKKAKTFEVNKLSVEAIDQIADSLTALRFLNEQDTIAAKFQQAKEAIRRQKEIKESVTTPPKDTELVRKVKIIHDNIESVSDAISGARPGTYDLWLRTKPIMTKYVYDVLDAGVDVQYRHAQEAKRVMLQILADNNVSPNEIVSWSARPSLKNTIKEKLGFNPNIVVHTFTLEDSQGNTTKYDFTTNELMAIFMHARNSHNFAVLLNDGVNRFVGGQKQKIRGFTVEIVDDMIAELTTQQKSVARQIGSKLLDGFNRDAINKTSVELEFYEIARVENYFPAPRSITRTLRGEQMRPYIMLLESMGMLKERTGINNPLRLTGFFETVYGSNKNAAAYVGLAKPLREVKSVLTQDVTEAMEDAGRKAESDRLQDLLTQFENTSPIIQPLDRALFRALGGFARSKLFLNLKIAPRQQISFTLVTAYVDPKYMTAARGIATKDVQSQIDAISPQYGTARSEGLQFDRDVGDAWAQNEMLNYLTGQASIVDKAALPMRFFDTNAIHDIFRVAKAEVIGENPNIDINSREGQALLKDRFDWLVRHTQPIWHVKDRSLLGGQKTNALLRAATMFMSQREQLMRMQINAISEFSQSKKTTADKLRLARVMGTVGLNMAAFTLYNFAFATLVQRKDRDILDLIRNFFSDMISLPFFGNWFARLFEAMFNTTAGKPSFRDLGETAIESIAKDILIDGLLNYWKSANHFIEGDDRWERELLVAIDSTAEGVAALTGLPYYGAKEAVKIIDAQIKRLEETPAPRGRRRPATRRRSRRPTRRRSR